jgi:hypothetical protein
VLVAHGCALIFGELFQADAVEGYGTGRGAVEAGAQAEQGGFAGAGRAYNGESIASGYIETDVIEYGKLLP